MRFLMSEENTSQCLFQMVWNFSSRIFRPIRMVSGSENLFQVSTDDSQEDVGSDSLFPMDEDEEFSGSVRSVSKYSPYHIPDDP